MGVYDSQTNFWPETAQLGATNTAKLCFRYRPTLLGLHHSISSLSGRKLNMQDAQFDPTTLGAYNLP